VDADFKDDFSATLVDAVRIQRRFQKTLDGWNYMVGICGSTVSRGKGKDVDVLVIATPTATIPAWKAAEQLISFHSKRLYLFQTEEYEEYVDFFITFVSHDNLYIDLYLKGNL
jgi:hypothetical protein